VFDVISIGIGKDTTVSEQSKSQENEDVYGKNSDHHSDSENENEGETNNQMQERRYPKRERKGREFPDILYQVVQTGDKLGETADFNEAMKAVDSNKWQHAMEELLQCLKINKAWNLVEPPNDKQNVTSGFIKSGGMQLEIL
jgi:hypothetical protein